MISLEAVKDELIYAKSWLLMRSTACWCGLVTKPSPYRLEPLECQYSPLLRPQTKNVPPCPIHLNT